MANNFSRFVTKYRILLIVVPVLGLLAGGVYLAYQYWPRPGRGGQTIPVSGGVITTSGGESMTDSDETRLSIQLSEGGPEPQEVTALPLATGEPLPEDAIERILARLPEISVDTQDQVDFRLAQEPIPPPRTGETIQQAFPPPQQVIQPGVIPAGPLEVLRYAPEGEIPLAPFVSVTFNQPMVPLTTLEQLSEEDVPVKIEPSLSGTWRWMGARTLTFEYDSELIDRLPKATEYRVTVPAGTQSQSGGVLAEAVTWTFSTPPPVVTNSYPYNQPQPLEPLFFIAFDQRINPAAVLESIKVRAGDQAVSVKLVDEADIQADPQVKNLVKNTPEGRWLAFRAIEPLPADTSVSVTVGPGTPSAEGPLLTDEPYSYSFHTYAPLRIVEYRCAWSPGECPPLTPFFIRFNNPIDNNVYEEAMLRIEPELPGASVSIFGDTINIQGATKGRTTYSVLVDGDIQDVFGQKLGEDTRLEFRVGPAEPRLIRQEQVLVTIDPAAKKPVFSVYAINYNELDVKIYAVQPSDWPAFKKYLNEYYRTDITPQLPGRLVLDKSLPVEAPADALTEMGIDLSQVMDGKYGHFIVVVQPPTGAVKNEQERFYQTVHAWVQVTQIGLDAFADHSEMVVWTSALVDGAPLSGVKVEALPGGISVVTGENGTVRFGIPDGASFLVASQGADRALLPRSPYAWEEGGWYRQSPTDELRWYVFDDRQMYRPGEEVHMKGWMRRIGGAQDGDVGLVGSAVNAVRYRVTDPQGNDLGGGRVDLNSLGGFDFSFTLPEKVNLGYAQLILEAQGSLGNLSSWQFYHSFQIQEFRRPEFEVNVRNETPPPYFAGEHAVVAVQASYYAGGPLPNADVTWQVFTSPGHYAPPNWPDFTFGTWEPWWWFYRPVYSETTEYFSGPEGEGQVEAFSGITDAAGEHFLRLDFDSQDPRPHSISAEATVMDVNRQAWTGTTNLLVHPAELYIGLRSERYFVERGTPLKVDFIVTDLDGSPVIDRPVEVRAARLEWKYRGGDWREEEADVQTCQAGSQAEPVTCTFETPVGGTYRITALVTDANGRQNQSQFTRWVSGGQQPPARKVEQEMVTLIPDKENYQPGEVAKILVQAPFSPAEGLLTVSRSGILYTERFTLNDGSFTLEVPIEEAHIPNLNIQVDVVGSAARLSDKGEPISGTPPRTAYAVGTLTLNIPPLQRTLSVQADPVEKELEPGGETEISITLKNADGEPVAGAELAVVVVDEAILALSNYQLADPIGMFYSTRPADVMSSYSRASIVLVDPLALAQEGLATNVILESEVIEAPAEAMRSMQGTMTPSLPAADMMAAGGGAEPIRVRIDFNPLAAFEPVVRTDADGTARIPVRLPDNLTRYRVMVVGVDPSGRQFGLGEASLVARLPLMVRPSAPRFLNFGDQFELPVVLQNQTDQPMQVEVVVRTANLELTGPAGLRVEVPERDRVEVRFPAAAQMAGQATIQVAAVSGDFADAATVELPVYTPATTEAFATYGVVDEGAVFQPLESPEGVFPQYGGLEVNTSSTALQALTDAVLYLVSYPFECTEQLASRILAVAALRDVLTAFEAAGLPSSQEMEAAVQRDITRLQSLQNSDGGFPYWRRGLDSIPFNTIHVAHALQRAELKGFSVPAEIRMPLGEYLKQIESHYPSWYSQSTRRTLSAYALYVRNLMGDRDPEKAMRLFNEAGLERLSLESLGWLWPVLQDAPGTQETLEAIRRYVNNRVVETAGAANFTTSYDDQTYLLLSSDRRLDAILLDALIGDNPQHDLIPKLVNGLLAHTTRGRWGNTQENVFVLLALDRYFNTFEAQTPNFVARIWLGDTYAGGHEYRGRTTERHETLVPMAYLVDESLGGGGTQNLVINKEGPGRLYYRLGLRYAPTNLEQEPLDMGFVVQRIYEAVDDPEDVRQDENGVWHIRAGARVRIRLTMVADNRRYHVALADPLPAGLEIVNPGLAVSGSIPQDPNSPDYRYGWWWWGPWYEHQNLRDERAEAFTPLLWDGVYQYTYIARATTPGRYIVPPAKAEEMYSPEVFGRSGSAVVIVE
ncbi:MAG TPA: alpha-2-macroglobulin family protein [Anaerolineales bacterium]|nr:alpha-2-macroglobulin family protein [Anaerolineales bacterium]